MSTDGTYDLSQRSDRQEQNKRERSETNRATDVGTSRRSPVETTVNRRSLVTTIGLGIAGAQLGTVGSTTGVATSTDDSTPGYGRSNLPRTADGWTDLSQLEADRTVYVSSTEGTDDGTHTRENPLQTIEAGVDQIRDGKADWLLLRRGDTWTITERGVLNGIAGSNSGRGPTARAVVTAYGDGPRPQLRLTSAGSLVNCFPDTGAARPAHIAVVGIEAYVYTRDPTNSAFEGGQTDGQDLFRMVGQDPIENYLIEDCAFRFASDVWGQAAGRRDGAVSENVEFRRNIVESMWSPHSETEWKKPMGLVMYRADGFLCDENVFYEVGKVDEIDHAKCNFLSHAIYLGVNGETKVTNYTVKGNYFVDSGHGFKGQADGRVEDNYFERDCLTNIAAATSSFESEPASLVTYNVKVNGDFYVNDRDYDWHADNMPQTPVARGFKLAKPDNANTPEHTVENNIVSMWRNEDGVFTGFANTDQDWVTMNGYNIVYDWDRSTAEPGQYQSNNTDGSSVTDPERDAAKYNAAVLGGTESYQDYMDRLLARGPGNASAFGDLSSSDWPAELTAYALNDYIRAGWDKPASGNAPESDTTDQATPGAGIALTAATVLAISALLGRRDTEE